VLIANGGLQALGFVAEALLAGESRRVLVEGPTYDRTLTILGRLGADVEAVPMDEEGLDLDALAAALDRGPRPGIRLHDPDLPEPERAHAGSRPAPRARGARPRARRDAARGRPLPARALRRRAAHDDARARGRGGRRPRVLLLEDRRARAPRRLRVLPRRLVGPVEAVAVASYITPVLLGQATVWEVIRRGRFFPNVERVRTLLRARRDAMLSALERELPEGASWSRPEGGYFVWAELGDRHAGAARPRAADAGVAIVKGSDFFPGGTAGRRRHGSLQLRLADEIGEGVAKLAALL
jgi:DNA-binding transcriptional MocR family regulator